MTSYSTFHFWNVTPCIYFGNVYGLIATIVANIKLALPLTKDDIIHISSKLGYDRTSDFVNHETIISTRDDNSMGGLITTITMLSLKRKDQEDESDTGLPCRCRFLSEIRLLFFASRQTRRLLAIPIFVMDSNL